MNINFNETLKHKEFLNKFVKIQTVDRLWHEGWMKSVDPLSGNILLAKLNNDKTKITETKLIMSDACLSVREHDSIESLVEFPLSGIIPTSPVDLSKVKERLIAWIKKHRLPVEENENGSLWVCDSVIISAPYRPEDCLSKNSRVLQRATELVRSFPHENDTIESELVNAASEIVNA